MSCLMTDAEIIDRLCAVTTLLADIVREQSEIILQAQLVYDGEKERKAAAELDELEIALRRRM